MDPASNAADKTIVVPTTLVADLLADGVTHHAAGRLSEAASRYVGAIERQADCGDAWRLLGVIALQTGHHDLARVYLERAIRINSDDAVAHSALGNVNESDGMLEAARLAYASARRLDVTLTAAVAGLARITLRLTDVREAIAVSEAGIACGMFDAGLFRTLGAARLQCGDHAAAADACLASLRITQHADAYANLAAAYTHLQRVDEAIAACEAALELDPAHAEAANNLGIAFKTQSSFAAALAAFERAIALGSEDAHINLGATRLLLGDYSGGWPEYGWISPQRLTSATWRSFTLWDGGHFRGRRLLVWPEQGTGDTIQMIRFLPVVRALGGSVTLGCQPGTSDLFQTLDGVDALTDKQPEGDAFDLWLPTIRLPAVLNTTPQSIPTQPYLRADPQRIERFRSLLDNATGRRIGLVWSGNPEFRWNTTRSCSLHELEPLGEIPDLTWFALQQGLARHTQSNSRLPLVAINSAVADFADTAAIMAQLDLIITVDTSVAHLAGALGRPAWVLLSNQPDWRWQRSGDVTPWYPTLRLFRQGPDRAWPPVVAAVADALREFASQRSTISDLGA